MTIHEAFWLLVENKWKIFQVLSLTIILAVFYHQWVPKIFEIKARIMIYPRQNSQNNAPDWLFELSGLETVHNISNELEILNSLEFLELDSFQIRIILSIVHQMKCIESFSDLNSRNTFSVEELLLLKQEILLF